MTHRALRLIATLFLILVPLSLSADVYTVTNTNDGFWGSLRDAMEKANSHPGRDTIVFAIGTGPKTIKLDRALPAITDALDIDGSTQPGWTGNPLIELDGTKVTNGSGLFVAAPQVTIFGLVINRFGIDGISIGDDFAGHVPSGTIIYDCWIGVGLDGRTGLMNGRDGIRVFANDCVIGGQGPHLSNVVSFNGANGITIGVHPTTGAQSNSRGLRNRIEANVIGLDASGSVPVANSGRGIDVVAGADNIIIGGVSGRNLIDRNGAEGIRIGTAAARTKIQSNDIVGNGYWGGSFAGISVSGPDTTITDNYIVQNTLAGVLVQSASGAAITHNGIFDNGGRGIELSSGGNGMISSPTVASAVHEGSQIRVNAMYQGRPNQTVILEVFVGPQCDPSGFGEGAVYVGSQEVVTNASGVGYYSLLFTNTGNGYVVTATAREVSTNNTSEFSACRVITYPPPTIVSIDRPGGRSGTGIIIGGRDFIGIKSVKFFDGVGNNISAQIRLITEGSIVLYVPPGAKTGPIVVTGTYGTATYPSFRITPPAGDIDGDGWPDLLWRNYTTGENSLWFSGSPAFGAALNPVSDVNWQIQGTSDFNNDGSHDILWRNYATGENVIWLMSGIGILKGASLPSVDPAWHIRALGDFDRDGDSDIVWCKDSTGEVAIWWMSGQTWSGSGVSLPTQPLEWRLEAAGDFNLDGSCDLLWRNYTTGENVIWLMNGTSQIGTASLATVGDPNWTIEAAFDWDGDGDLDVVWHNVATGETTVWLLVGAFWGGSHVDLTTVSDTNWRIEDF